MGLDIVLQMVTSFAMLLIFIRFMLQFAGIDPRNPYVAAAFKTTKIVDIFGRIFPTLGDGRVSTAAIVLMFLIRLIDVSGTAVLHAQGYTSIQLFFYSSVSLILDFLRMCRYLIFGSIIASWIVVFTNSMHPIIELLNQLAEPILAPFRKITPNMGMLDLSPMVAILVLILVEIFVETIAVNIIPMLG